MRRSASRPPIADRLGRAARIGLAAAALLGGAHGAGAATDAENGGDTAAAEFAAVCGLLTEGDAPYFGRRPAEDLAARVAGSDSISAVLLRIQLGFEQIRLGRLEEAIATLEEALERGRAAGISAGGSLELAAMSNLAMARFQLAEDQNCISFHTQDSCILPVRAGAVHRRPEEIRRALELFGRLLSHRPDSASWRWLYNLAAMLAGDYPEAVRESLRLPAGHLEAGADFPRWRDLAPALGVDSFDHGGTAVIDDFDGDGLLDLVSSSWDPCEPLRAFRNRGDGGFEDVTETWGLDGQLGAINVVQGDYDGDGDLDLVAFRGAWLGEAGRIRNSLLENRIAEDGGRFVDVTVAAGLAYPAYPSHSGAWADYDGDGDLDLYVGNEASAGSIDPLSLYGATGTAFPSQLFRNRGDGTFRDVARQAGVTDLGYTKGVTWGDYDDDGDPDLYVSNIGPNRLYQNRGDGTFGDATAAAGVAAPEDGSFATWFFDHDNDGDLDLFVARYNTRPEAVFGTYFGRPAGGQPVLYRNDGGRFTDVAPTIGLDAPALAMGANFGDLDGDGWLDFYLGTGVPDYEALMPNLMYRNVGGARFEDVTFAGGFGHLQKGHGVAFGDLDNDGDQDLYQQLGGAFPYDAYGNALYENPFQPSTGGRWITLRLEGRKANRFAVGARIEVVVREGESRRSIHHLVGSGGSFGASSLQAEIGLGRAEAIEAIHIDWPLPGGRQSFQAVEPDAVYLAVEGEGPLRPIELRRFQLAPAAGRSRHRH